MMAADRLREHFKVCAIHVTRLEMAVEALEIGLSLIVAEAECASLQLLLTCMTQRP